MAKVFWREGAWWINFKDANGVRRRKKVGTVKRVAEELLADTVAKVVREEHLGILDSTVSFAAYARQWLETMRGKKPRTYVQYETIVRRHLIPAFPGSLKAVSASRAEAYVAERRKAGAKPATINVSLAVLKAIVRAAVRDKHLRHNPLADLKPCGGAVRRSRYLERDEITKLIAACRDTAPDATVPGVYLEAFVLVALNAGMRRNEIAHLTRRHVNWTARLAQLDETKSGKPRLVPLNDTVIAALKSLPPRLDTDRFFPFKPVDLTRAFGAAVRRAGIQDFRLHDCRHTFSTWQAMGGLSPRGLQEILGHADPRMTMRYSHLSDAYLRAAVDRVQLDGRGEPGTLAALDASAAANPESDRKDAPAQGRTGT